MSEKMLLCGKIVNTHGLRGEVKLIMYTDGPEFFDSVKKLYTKDGTAYRIKTARPHKGALIVEFSGVDSIEKAELLRDAELYADRTEIPPLPEGRFFVVDIIGLCVVTDDGRSLGTVTDVFSTGSNDVYTVKNEEKEYLIPVTDEVVLNIDIEKGEILIHPLKGLIDDEN